MTPEDIAREAAEKCDNFIAQDNGLAACAHCIAEAIRAAVQAEKAETLEICVQVRAELNVESYQRAQRANKFYPRGNDLEVVEALDYQAAGVALVEARLRSRGDK